MSTDKLEVFNSNIVRWYPFKSTESILQIGVNKHVLNYLDTKFDRCDCVEDINQQEIISKYDYVLIFGYKKNKELLSKVVTFLNDNGKLLIVGNNDLGINNWSKYNENRQTGVLMLENHLIDFQGITDLKNDLIDIGYNEINTFYVFPDYYKAELILNDKFNIGKEHIEKYNPNINQDDIKVFDEINVLKNVLKNNPKILDYFANSYLLEVSKQNIENDIRYVSFNNCRKEQYRLMTVIKDDVVEKLPANDISIQHIQNMEKIIQEINTYDIELLDYIENEKIYSRFIKDVKTLDRVLAQKIDNIDEIVNTLNDIKQILLNHSLAYNNCKDNITIKSENEIDMENLHYMKNAFWDMIPKNCFYIDNKFYFFDQEWEKGYLPVEFIIYRSVINSYDLVRKIDVDMLLEKLDILQYKDYFSNIDEQLRSEIIDEQIYSEMYNNQSVKAIDNFINDNKFLSQENNNKEEYIKKLEKYIDELKEDNQKKQEYINLLENNQKNEGIIQKITKHVKK